ncbi:MAG: methylated-DNA--[protein]-cysteine S-methyltransferase [Nitrospirae bacterium]|nr:methylated-DNA--[protein]-cysteine S-methyltransferase [Nitrospirota bacterium]
MKGSLVFERISSPIGFLYVVFSGKHLVKLALEKPKGIKAGEVPGSFKEELMAYFEGRSREFHQEMVFLSGTDFEKKVWLTLKDVPYGQTRTYKWLSEKIGKPKAHRAVGQALSKNPISIVLPCHRIIDSDGHIGGYSSGIDIKRRLLELEYYYSEDI